MDEAELEQLAREAFEGIFTGQTSITFDGEVYHMEKTSASRLRKLIIEGLSFIEQNPHKDSQWWR